MTTHQRLYDFEGVADFGPTEVTILNVTKIVSLYITDNGSEPHWHAVLRTEAFVFYQDFVELDDAQAFIELWRGRIEDAQ